MVFSVQLVILWTRVSFVFLTSNLDKAELRNLGERKKEWGKILGQKFCIHCAHTWSKVYAWIHKLIILDNF